MKVAASIKKRCPSCRVVKRGLYRYIRCDKNSKHNQRQG